jgi:NitT/TauT family transport system ATP-binding protein
MAYLKLRNVVKEFRNGDNVIKVLDGVSFDVRKGEFITIFGPNGCGKTTLLNILSEFHEITSGRIQIGRYSLADIKSYIVFQNPNDSLFNWMNVEDNIKISTSEQSNHKILEILNKIQVAGKKLTDFKHFYPYQLSGGLKQLTVIARAFVFNPHLLLLDEPFSSLDYKTATDLEHSLLDIWEKTKQTIIFVSHNIDEAVYLADKIVILSNPPTKVNKIIEVKLPRPRKQEIKLSGEFQRIKQQVLDHFGDCNE